MASFSRIRKELLKKWSDSGNDRLRVLPICWSENEATGWVMTDPESVTVIAGHWAPENVIDLLLISRGLTVDLSGRWAERKCDVHNDLRRKEKVGRFNGAAAALLLRFRVKGRHHDSCVTAVINEEPFLFFRRAFHIKIVEIIFTGKI